MKLKIEELQEKVKDLVSKTHWAQTEIVNREQQKQAFLQAHKSGEDWNPDFRFQKPETSEVKEEVQKGLELARSISEKDIENAGFKVLDEEDLEEFFAECLRELGLYIDLTGKVDDREAWREVNEEIWPMVSEEKYRESLEKIEGLENRAEEKVLKAEDVKELFEEEIEGLGFEYNVEIRDVDGCHNIPEEKTLVVAKGSSGERLYSEREAKMLAKHEIFHVVRGVNGRNLSDTFSITGVHSPFYDKTEEGGAVLREHETDVNYSSKDFDYHLRLIAAYEISQGKTLEKIAEKLIDLGASPERSFYLITRNRKALRHHIYLSGLDDWEEKDREKLMIGKLNPKWTEKFWKEVEKGDFNRPEISAEEVFEK